MTLRLIHFERLHQSQPRFGRHVLHDSESRRYPVDTTDLSIRSVRWTRRVPVWNQADLGSCTGNAAVGCLGTDPFFTTISREAAYPLSEDGAVAVYSAATGLDPVPGQYPPDDTGSDGLSVAKVLTAAGMISGYRHAFSLDAALKALQLGPVICGTLWVAGMDNPNSAGLVSVTGPELGGHEYVADEYDDQRGWVGFTNSWGTTFGVNGRFYLQAEDFGTLLERDGDVTVFTPNTQPAPEPTPSPVPAITADETLARALHHWLDTHPHTNRRLQTYAENWLIAKGL